MCARYILALCVSAGLSTVGYGQIFEKDKGEAAWSQYHKALSDFLGGTKKPNVIQTLAVAQRVEWDTSSPEHNLYLKQDIANAIPTWGPLYQRSAGRTVADEYLAFLDLLNSKLIGQSALANKGKLEKLSEERRSVRTKLDKLEQEVSARWLKYVKSTPPSELLSKPEWEQRKGYSADRELYEQQIQQIEGAYLVEINNAGPELKEIGRAIAALGNSTQRIALPSTPELIPLGKDSWEYFYRTFLDGDVFKFKAENGPLYITLKEGQSETANWSKSWNAHASIGWCLFFSASGGVEHQDESRKFESDTKTLSISFQNIKPFNITRGQWFKGGLVQKYLPKVDPSFWSEAGRLNLIPTQLVLAHGLKVDITTSHEARDYVYQRHHVGGGGGFSIGPFGFGGGGGSTTTFENLTVDKTETGLHIEDTSGRAIVIAVISERPADLLDSQAGPYFPDLYSSNREQADALLKDALGAADEKALKLTLHGD